MGAVARLAQPGKNIVATLLEAIQWAERGRIPVSVDGYGVTATSVLVSPIWERDTSAESVDPIGAAILMAQPVTKDVERAALIALDANPALVVGLETGLRNELRAPEMLNAPNRRLYVYGVEVGAMLRRMIVAHDCILHGRFGGTDALCPLCEEQLIEDAERAAAGEEA